jgi:hypothetical protein
MIPFCDDRRVDSFPKLHCFGSLGAFRVGRTRTAGLPRRRSHRGLSRSIFLIDCFTNTLFGPSSGMY